MASLGQLVLVVGLAFLVLASQDHSHGGPAGGGLAIGAAAVITPQPPLTPELAENKRGPIPKSGPSDKWNYEVHHEKPSSSAASGGRRRTRTIVVGRRLGSA